MSVNKCKTCGGLIVVNTNSGIGTCDSCGNTVDVDKETIKKYQTILNMADIKMKYNSVKNYEEAISMLEEIPFVDGAKERIEICKNRIAELKALQEAKSQQSQKENKKNTKLGIVIVVCIVVGFVLLVSGTVYLVANIIRGEFSQGVAYALIVVAVVAVIALIINKNK